MKKERVIVRQEKYEARDGSTQTSSLLVFPERLEGFGKGEFYIQCWSPEGGHAECSQDWLKETIKGTKEQGEELLSLYKNNYPHEEGEDYYFVSHVRHETLIKASQKIIERRKKAAGISN